jgi:hypothetical protein
LRRATPPRTLGGMRFAGWWLSVCLLAACGGESARADEDDDDDASGGNVGTGGNATTGGSAGTAGTSGTAGAPADWGVICSQSANLTCEKWLRCLPRLAEVFLPRDCAGSFLDECLNIVALPDVTISPSDYESCVQEFARLSCDEWLYGGTFEGCVGFSGRRSVGEPCGDNIQCTTGACSASLGCGVCEERSVEGESCLERNCAGSLECGSDSLCREPRYLGDPCDDASPCYTALTCVGGVCAKRGGQGTSCAVDGLSCDFLQGVACGEDLVCQPIAIPTLGEACTGICVAGTICSVLGFCVEALREGDACSLDAGINPCDRPLACIDGICAHFDPTSCG